MNRPLAHPATGERTLVPSVIPHEDENGIRLDIALPGVRKEDLKLTLHHADLEIDAARSTALPEKAHLRHGSAEPVRYRLKARLTDRLDGQAIQANLDNGVLTVVIPYSKAAKPREILVA